jgi:hypothetical protein
MCGDGTRFGVRDIQHQKALSLEKCVDIYIKAIYNKEVEIWITPLYFKFAIPITKFFPKLMGLFMKNRLKKQLLNDRVQQKSQ